MQVLAGIEPIEGANFIKSLVAGGPVPPSRKEEAWLWDVVANKRNGVDVDKFDYLVRDAAATGTSVSLDFQRLMLKSRVVEGQVRRGKGGLGAWRRGGGVIVMMDSCY